MAKNPLDEQEKEVVVQDAGQQFATSVVMPKVDELVESSKTTVTVSRVDIEQALDGVMNQMVQDGLVTQEKINEYKQPQETHHRGRRNSAWSKVQSALGISTDIMDHSQFIRI